jgi:hypothetical protein
MTRDDILRMADEAWDDCDLLRLPRDRRRDPSEG